MPIIGCIIVFWFNIGGNVSAFDVSWVLLILRWHDKFVGWRRRRKRRRRPLTASFEFRLKVAEEAKMEECEKG